MKEGVDVPWGDKPGAEGDPTLCVFLKMEQGC